MLRSNPEPTRSGSRWSAGGLQNHLQDRLLGQIAERQQNSAKGNEVWMEILHDRISVGGYRLEAVLRAVEERLGTDAQILRTERKIVGGVRGFFGRECFVVEASLPQVDLPSGEAAHARSELSPPPAPIEAPVGAEGPSFAKALAAALAEVERVETELGLPHVAVVEQDIAPNLAPEPIVAPEAIVAPEPTAAPASTVVPAPEPQLRSDAAFLSLEARYLTRDELEARVAELTGTVAGTPRRGIVAVVGDPDECVTAARNLAVSQGGDPGEVLVMSPEQVDGHPSWMCVTSIADCEKRRARWSGDKRLHIVAVVLNAGPDGMEWACTSLDALAPDQTRLAVPAWRRAEDMVGRLRSLAPIAAVDLVGPADPATVVGFLDLEAPVATINGAPATVRLWCAHLVGDDTSDTPDTPDTPDGPDALYGPGAPKSVRLPRVPTSRLQQVVLDQLLTVSNGEENIR